MLAYPELPVQFHSEHCISVSFAHAKVHVGIIATVRNCWSVLVHTFYLTFGTCLIFQCALVTGYLTSGLHSATLIVSFGAIVQAVVLFWLLLFYRFSFLKLLFICVCHCYCCAVIPF